MKIKCEYCGNFIEDTDECCPHCAGVNDHLVRTAHGTPQTIEELKKWCQDKNIPLEQARFFIGVDYQGARAFGIYKDEKTDNFIVYKNKSDGSRAVRYEGKDESYAVNEIYQKLKEEILNQKQHQNQNKNASAQGSTSQKHVVEGKKRVFRGLLIIFILVVVVGLLTCGISNIPDRGYYEYGNQVYYYQPSDGWYLYDDGDWNHTSVDSTLSDNYETYYDSSSYDSQYNTSDFSDSGYYEESSNDDSYDSDWDSGWDSGSDWDSGYSDWDSDW